MLTLSSLWLLPLSTAESFYIDVIIGYDETDHDHFRYHLYYDYHHYYIAIVALLSLSNLFILSFLLLSPSLSSFILSVNMIIILITFPINTIIIITNNVIINTSIIINTVNSDHSHKNNTGIHNAQGRTWQYTCKEPVPRIPWTYRSHKALYHQVYFTPMPWMPYQHYPGITHWRGKCHIAQHSKRRSLSTKLVHSSCVTPELFLAHLLYNTPRTLPKLKILTS